MFSLVGFWRGFAASSVNFTISASLYPNWPVAKTLVYIRNSWRNRRTGQKRSKIVRIINAALEFPALAKVIDPNLQKGISWSL